MYVRLICNSKWYLGVSENDGFVVCVPVMDVSRVSPTSHKLPLDIDTSSPVTQKGKVGIGKGWTDG